MRGIDLFIVGAMSLNVVTIANAATPKAATPKTPAAAKAPAVTPTPAPEAPAVTAPTPIAEENDSMFGSKRPWIGASLGASILRGTVIEADTRTSNDLFSVSLGYGFLPALDLKAGAVNVNIGSSDLFAEARWHPFKGSFFLGGEIGHYSLTFTGDASVSGSPAAAIPSQSVAVSLDATYSKTYLGAKLGWFGGTGGGFVWGSDLSLHMNLSSSSTVDLKAKNSGDNAALDAVKSQPDYQKKKKDLEDILSKLGNNINFSWTLLRLGWLF